jgi:predicted ABC-type ATPase
MGSSPNIIILAGPNGAGKTTISREVLANTLGITEFVNADIIAAGLSGFDPERAAFAAGRIMLARLRELADAKTTFAFESTLASRTFAPWLIHQKARGYEVHIVYS